jgi:hypothetical protein
MGHAGEYDVRVEPNTGNAIKHHVRSKPAR